MDQLQAIEALRETGELLARTSHPDMITVILGGAIAAMVVADIPASRITHDCDVVASEPDAGWESVHAAALQVAKNRGYPAQWLNCDSRIYAHYLPPGWRKRCEVVGRFGPLEVLVISRRDLMAMKLMGAPVRPQDLEDIIRMKPIQSDIAFLREHLHRLEAESLDRQTHEAQLTILDTLEPDHDPA